MPTRILIALVAVAASWRFALAQDGDASAKFKITSGRPNDAIVVRTDKDAATFDVKCPFGISRASIERQDEQWPKTVVFRLHLKGLENVKASNGKTTIEGSASIQDGKPKTRLWKDGRENAPLDDTSPFWIAIRILETDGAAAKAIPLQNGYFELTLPKAFFEGNPKSISVSWIDFYRT